MSFDSLPDVMTIVQAAKYLGIGRNTAYQAARRNELPHVHICGRILVHKQALMQLFDRGAGTWSPA